MTSTVKPSYGASVAVFGASDLNSLASSSSWVAGFESNVIDNTSALALDALLAGRFKAGTSPTAGQIQVYVGAPLNDTPSYPDVFDGTGSAETITSQDIRNSILVPVASMITDTTTGRVYEFAPVSVAELFGGILPPKWFVFVTHSLVAALDSSAGGQCWYTPMNYTVG